MFSGIMGASKRNTSRVLSAPLVVHLYRRCTLNTSDSITVILLTKDQHAIIDTIDSDLAELSWHAHYSLGKYYAGSGRKGQKYLHRVILERVIQRSLRSHEEVDHINGDSLDNRRCNLRVCTHQQNQRNIRNRKSGTSIYHGVSYDKINRTWKSQIRIDGKNVNLGRYATAIDAAIVYNHAAHKHFKEFAVLNNINEWQDILPAKLHARSGEKHVKAKLTWDKVREIRHRYAQGNSSYSKLSREFNVSKDSISKIINNRHWKEELG